MLDEDFEEGELLVRGRAKNVVWGFADNGCANGEEVACDVGVASVKGERQAVMEEGACAGWVLG